MKLTFKTKEDGSYYELTKGNEFGYKLSLFTPTKKADAKTTHTCSSTFYATLEQAANKITFLELDGHSLDDIVNTYSAVLEKIVETLTEEK